MFKPQILLTLIYVVQTSFAAPTIDVSGRKGNDASNGYDQSGTASTAQTGAHGGHAGEAQEGQDAGKIDLHLSREKGVYLINGVIHLPDGLKKEMKNLQVSLAERGNLALIAEGGGGGAGGNGGDGQKGGPGADGSDATRYTWGSDGDRGARGGDAGAGSSGKKAGKGGDITVTMHEKDTALLMLVESNVKGGKGGPRGRHGSPGPGGDGGEGGDEYVWYETVKHESQDSEGNDTSTTEEVRHSNPGGSDGPTGPEGDSQTAALYDGEDGPKGTYTIKVITESGETKIFQRRYDLVLEGYDHNSEDLDGILEPGEKVLVSNVKVKNTGGMPTPAHTKIRIFLRNSVYSVADSVELIIPKSLVPGESYTFSKEVLTFHIQNNLLKNIGEERVIWNDSIRPLAEMTEVDREFKGFSQDRPIQISFPVEIESVAAERSLAPGEKSKVVLRVKNISNKDFGSESELRRQLDIAIKRMGGDIAKDGYRMTDMNGNSWNAEEGLLKTIAKLKAGESALIEGIVEIAKSAEAYRALDLGFTLDIDTPHGEKKRTSIQRRGVSFRVSKTYQVDPQSDILLVVNNSTSRDVIQAFESLAKLANLKVNVWDISYYGEMSLTKLLNSGSSLAQDFKDKTIVVLNNDFKTNNGDRQAHQLILHQELVEAAARQGISTLFLGGHAEDMGRNIELRPIDASVDTKISVQKRKAFMKAKSEDLQKIGLQKLNQLLATDPLGSYQVVYKFEPELIKKGFLGMGKLWSLGTLEVIHGLDGQGAQLLTLAARDGGAMTPAEVRTRDAQLSLFMAVSFDKRVTLLNNLLGGENPTAENMHTGRAIAESILLDLAEEQVRARTLKYNFGTNSVIKQRLPKLQNLLAEAETLIARSHRFDTQAVWMELINGIRELAKENSPWWKKLIPFGTASEFRSETLRLADKIEAKVYPNGIIIGSKDKFTSHDMKQIKEAAKSLDRTAIPGQTRISNMAEAPQVVSSSSVSAARKALRANEQTVAEAQAEIKQSSQAMKAVVECKVLVGGR